MIGMASEKKSRLVFSLLMGVLALLVVGCQENGQRYQPLTLTNPQKPEPDLGDIKAGVPPQAAPQHSLTDLVEEKNFRTRNDAFALMPIEVSFDQEQRTENLVSQHNYAMEVTLNPDQDETDRGPVVQPAPNWRLSGVIIGNGVLALLDTGARTYEIRPGMTVPGTNWRVKSIDSERAVLVREGNVLPKEFSVGLQGPIAGSTLPGGFGGGSAPGAQGGRQGGGGIQRGGIGGIG